MRLIPISRFTVESPWSVERIRIRFSEKLGVLDSDLGGTMIGSMDENGFVFSIHYNRGSSYRSYSAACTARFEKNHLRPGTLVHLTVRPRKFPLAILFLATAAIIFGTLLRNIQLLQRDSPDFPDVLGSFIMLVAAWALPWLTFNPRVCENAVLPILMADAKPAKESMSE